MANGNANSNKRRARRRRLLVERLGQRRVLASLTGSVFEDLNFSSEREVGEPVAPRRLVYIDANDNATLDPDERYALADLDGEFEFEDLANGQYLVRLFNGTDSQTQTTPLSASVQGSTVTVEDVTQVLAGDDLLGLTDQTVVVGDSATGQSEFLAVGNELEKMQSLPDGRLLVVGSDTNGPTAWLVDPETETVTPIGVDGNVQTAWSELAIDGNGRGVLLNQAIGQSIVRSVDATDPSNGISASVTDTTVPTDTQVLTSQTGSRSVFAWNGSDGLKASLWSNVTSSFITSSPTDLSGTIGLLSFDDASGLLAARNTNGGVNIYDVDANFAPLHAFNNLNGPVAIDGPRELLLSISPIDSALRLINLRDGSLIADFALELSAIGSIASLALDPNSNRSADSLAVLGAAGIAEIALDRATAQEITIENGVDPDPILFGVGMTTANDDPEYVQIPSFQTNEDSSLFRAAPAALLVSLDANADDYVLVQLTDTANGTVTARVDGSLQYTPRPDFNGIDSFEVLLHDGRDASEPYEIQITVLPVPDSPDDIIIDLPPITELVTIGSVVGTVEVIDADGGGHTITIDDERFQVQGADIVFAGGELDAENEPTINLTVSVRDAETDDVIEKIFAASVLKDNTIQEINPDTVEVPENRGGETVAEINVLASQPVTLTVDDDRFEINGNQILKLKTDVELDFEQEQTIVVQVTATGTVNGDKLTEPITIHVIDIPEEPTDIALSNETVLELAPGNAVGSVTVDGLPPRSYYAMSVNDQRFEIVDGTLKLRENVMVDRAEQSEIELSITAQFQGETSTLTEIFVLDVLENSAPFHNHNNPYDVDHNGRVTAADALVIINFLNSFGPGPVGRGTANYCYDVNADSLVTALDALLVLNELGRIEQGNGTVGGEGDAPTDQSEGEGPPAEGEPLPEGEPLAEGEPLPSNLLTVDAPSAKISSNHVTPDSAASDLALVDLTDSENELDQDVTDSIDLLSDD